MSVWILPTCVRKNNDYYYELDKALDTLKTIFWAQSRPITNIEVGDIVYIYEGLPIQAIGWKCKVLAVKASYEESKTIDDSAFEHGYSEPANFYIKITAIGKYDDEARAKLSYAKLCENGLKYKMQGPFRPKGQPLVYINSVKPSVEYND